MSDVVVDASVVLRRLLDRSPGADAVLRRGALTAPSVIVAEVLNGLVSAVRFGGMRAEAATRLLAEFRELRLQIVPDEVLADATLAVAVSLNLSAYDAAYAALSAELGVPLATSDRRLATAYPKAELID